MSASYKSILWNRQKRIYDLIVSSFILLYLGLFALLSLRFFPTETPETIIIRATGTLALLMLHVILSIGPLSRIDKRLLILLYNRRHLGVSMFFIALIHGIFNMVQFHSLGNVNPFVSLFTSNSHYNSFINFPFQVLGFFALIILMLMAATSHDFWLKNLSPKTWKTLHMMVYLAYALIIMHVMLGVMELEHDSTFLLLLLFGIGWLITLHLYAGFREIRRDHEMQRRVVDGFIEAGDVNDIPEKRAKIIFANGERIAIFKFDGKLAAVSNVCKHQNGPLGEGRIVDGCITCPWHGFQYRPEDGCAPPPFTEKIATYPLRIVGNKIYVNTKPNAEGTFETPVII
jgi:sulfoxide reductase heme-binding subunit YedZ